MITIKAYGTTLKLEPCPCCGHDKLYVGPNSSNTTCIHCFKTDCLDLQDDEDFGKGCGLKMVIQNEEVWKKAIKTCKAKGSRRFDALIHMVTKLSLIVAAKRWNKRA
tara:strand:- start:541 stop:861 length:321 start_codon:yes stop_codon:yes gene_type:complete